MNDTDTNWADLSLPLLHSYFVSRGWLPQRRTRGKCFESQPPKSRALYFCVFCQFFLVESEGRSQISKNRGSMSFIKQLGLASRLPSTMARVWGDLSVYAMRPTFVLIFHCYWQPFLLAQQRSMASHATECTFKLYIFFFWQISLAPYWVSTFNASSYTLPLSSLHTFHTTRPIVPTQIWYQRTIIYHWTQP
jgi:hypothetical protein